MSFVSISSGARYRSRGSLTLLADGTAVAVESVVRPVDDIEISDPAFVQLDSSVELDDGRGHKVRAGAGSLRAHRIAQESANGIMSSSGNKITLDKMAVGAVCPPGTAQEACRCLSQ